MLWPVGDLKNLQRLHYNVWCTLPKKLPIMSLVTPSNAFTCNMIGHTLPVARSCFISILQQACEMAEGKYNLQDMSTGRAWKKLYKLKKKKNHFLSLHSTGLGAASSDAEVRFSLVHWLFLWTVNWTCSSVQIKHWTLDWTICSGSVVFGSGSAVVWTQTEPMNFWIL